MEQKSRIVAAAIVAAVVVAAGAAVAILEHFDTPKRDSIGVFDVQLDKERRAWVDRTALDELRRLAAPPAKPKRKRGKGS